MYHSQKKWPETRWFYKYHTASLQRKNYESGNKDRKYWKKDLEARIFSIRGLFFVFSVFYSFNILFLVWELIISILKIIHKKFQRQTFIFEIFMFMRSIKSCYIFQRLSDTFQAAFCLDWLILYTKRIQSRIVIN